MVTIFLADDHDTVRAGTRSYLQEFDIVGEADNTAQGPRHAARR